MTPALIASAFLALAASPAAAPAAPPPISDWRPVDPANTLILDTSKGRIVIELHPEIAPLHVARMKALARQGKMNAMPFYRVIKGFMAQAGNMKAASGLPNLKAEFEFVKTPALSYAAMAPSNVGELGFIGSMPVVIDPDGTKGHVKFCPGVGALAHQVNQPDSANGQYFLMRGRATSLEKEYSPWGRAIIGREIIEAIKDGEPAVDPDKIVSARVMADIPAAQRPDIQVMDTRSPAFAAAYAAAMQAKGVEFHICDVEIPVKGS